MYNPAQTCTGAADFESETYFQLKYRLQGKLEVRMSNCLQYLNLIENFDQFFSDLFQKINSMAVTATITKPLVTKKQLD